MKEHKSLSLTDYKKRKGIPSTFKASIFNDFIKTGMTIESAQRNLNRIDGEVCNIDKFLNTHFNTLDTIFVNTQCRHIENRIKHIAGHAVLGKTELVNKRIESLNRWWETQLNVYLVWLKEFSELQNQKKEEV